METKGEGKPKPRRRARLIVRLGAFLISHSVLVSVLCCTAGIVALFLLPVLAKNTYISENALMPGSANPMFSSQDLREADRLIKAVLGQSSSDGKRLETPRLIAEHMADLGAEVYYHKFHPRRNQFHPFSFFSPTISGGSILQNDSFIPVGINSVGIIRAPRGDGKESIVMITPYNSQENELNDAVALGLGFSIFSHLSQVAWLAKDIVWVAADSQFGEHDSVAAWLQDYHNPNLFSEHNIGKAANGICTEGKEIDGCNGSATKGGISDVFRRAGTMAAGLVVKVTERKEGSDSVTIYSEASNGQMPNLDLINIVHFLAVHRQAFRVKVAVLSFLLNSTWLKVLGNSLEWLSKTAGSINPKWSFGITAADYVEGTATLANSIYNQALGVPTGPHGGFRDYQVDAITLEISPRISLYKDLGQSAILIRGGRLIEGVIRSVNNLLEKFHQSFFLYFLTSPSKFVSVGVYMIAFALLVAPLPIVAAALFSGGYENKDFNSNLKPGYANDSSNDAVSSWQWIHAARVAFTVHLWAAVVSLLPGLIFQIPETTPISCTIIWITFSIILLIFFYVVFGTSYSSSQNSEWRLLKAVTIAVASIGLGLMSIINFATAQIGALFVVPMCLMVQPLRRCKVLMLSFLNIALGIIAFPPATALITEGFIKGFGGVGFGSLWQWAALLWSWNSATYLYVFFIHLPCWLLCVLVLLHP